MVGACLWLRHPRALSLCICATLARRCPRRGPTLRLADLFQGYTHLPLSIRHNNALGDSDRCHDYAADLVHRLSKRCQSHLDYPVRDRFRCVDDRTTIRFQQEVDLAYVRE